MLITKFGLLTCLAPLALAYVTLSNTSLNNIPDSEGAFDINDGALLAPILVPRVPGTPGSLAVLQHFLDFFRDSLPEWRIELQNSTATTPATGDRQVPFVNLIASRDPPWSASGDVGRLSLVAHYDSKMTPEGFIGATDSAAPCAMLLQTAKILDAALTAKWKHAESEEGFDGSLESEKGLQIILLDGEEAFVSWTDTDSTYGARSLAAEWEETLHPAMSTYHNLIRSIDLFLLLDLLGASNPYVPSYFETTHWAYRNMATLEKRLRALGQFRSSPNHPSKRSDELAPRQGEPLFLPEADKEVNKFRGLYIGDDHVPFLARGVEVLHIIPSPFPDDWHKMTDDGEHLDMDVVEDWTKLVTAFTAEWMEVEGYLDHAQSVSTKKKSSQGKHSEDKIDKSEL